jgi:hypothetical protein
MKITINESQFIEAFRTAGRDKQFSYKGLRALYSYFEQYEEDTGEEMELDVIAICCDYTEADWRQIADDYSIDLPEDEEEKFRIGAVIDYLTDKTDIVNEISEGVFVYQKF